jgi:hypothetical protein
MRETESRVCGVRCHEEFGKRLLFVLVPVIFVVVPIASLAQSYALSGLIRDPGGQPISNASIELREQETGVRWKAVTKRDGSYGFRGLKTGLYQATVQARGFKALTRDGIRVREEAKVELNLVLEQSGDKE